MNRLKVVVVYIVEYKSPYSGDLIIRKFKSKYRANSESRAYEYAQRMHHNYYQQITVVSYETLNGKRTGRGITLKGIDKERF